MKDDLLYFLTIFGAFCLFALLVVLAIPLYPFLYIIGKVLEDGLGYLKKYER